MRRRSIRFRLTVWYAVALAAGLSLFSVLIWASLRHRLMQEIDQDLEGRAGRFERYFASESTDAAGDQLLDELQEFCQALPPSSYVELRGTSGFAFRYPAEGATTDNGLRTLRRQFALHQETFYLQISAPVSEAQHTLDLLALLLWSAVPVVIAIASVGGAWLSGRALKPVNDITAAAQTISIENLAGRLPVPPTGDELARLTQVLNTMFARLESAVKTLSQFVADASHELRTPLAVIRTTAELALRRTRTPESYRDSLQEVATEAERMTRLVDELLMLARNDTATAEMPLTAIDVREVLAEVCAEMRTLAETRQIRIDADYGGRAACISGDHPALHRLFVVLLDNALKFSRSGAQVKLAVESSESQVTVRIQDSGSGIRESDLPHIFTRFYRVDGSRNRGHGLGLSLAQSIARLHGATIEVQSREGAGSTFLVTFSARDGGPAAGREASSVPSVNI